MADTTALKMNNAQAYDTFKGESELPEQKGTRFPAAENATCKDPLWAVFFWVHVLAVMGFVGWKWHQDLAKSKDVMQDIKLDFNTGYIPAALVALAFAVVSAVVWTLLVRSCAFALYVIAFGLNLIILLASAAASMMTGNVIKAAICGGLAALYCVYLWFIWGRIAFSALLARTVTGIIFQAPGVLCMTLGSLIPAILLSLVALAAIGALKYEMDHATSKEQHNVIAGTIVLMVFHFYWTSGVIANVVHTTICGVVGRWYFKASDWSKATSVSLRWALTKSFGSICFGSFVLAIVNTIRFIINVARSSAESNDNIAGQIILCILNCIVGCIESLIEFINTYAFVYCAVYGQGFIEGAKSTWELFKRAGLDMIVAQDLTGVLTFFGSFMGGGLSALLTWATIHFTGDTMTLDGRGWLKPKDGDLTPVYVGFSFLAGFIMVLVASTPLESGVTALLVCYAEEPSVLDNERPELAEKFADFTTTDDTNPAMVMVQGMP